MSKAKASAVDEANMRAVLESQWARTQYGGIVEEMPFDRLLLAEDDEITGGDEGPGDYEMMQRVVGVKGLYRYLLAEGNHPLAIMKRLYAAGAAMNIEAFASLTMEERALMFGETKAAVSFRMKKLSGMIERAGMKGSRLPGQKSKDSTANYSAAQIGNQNRRSKRLKLRKKI